MSDFGFGDIFGIGSIVNGLLGYQGQKKTNEANIEMARETNSLAQQMAINQQAFQERMSNTSYQRAIKDMSSAGLNPMLAYSQGGSSTPSGAQAALTTPTIGNKIGAGLSSAMQAMSTIASVDNLNANSSKAEADAAVARATMPKVAADARAANANASVAEYNAKELLPIDRTHKLNQLGVSSYEGTQATLRESQLRERMKYEMSGLDSDARRKRAQALLDEYSLSEGKAYSEFYDGAGKYKPHLDAAGGVASSAGSLIRNLSPYGRAWSLAKGFRR